MTLTQILPLGDQAALAYFDDEVAALRFAAELWAAPWPWLVDVVPAYASVGVYFDGRQTGFDDVAGLLQSAASKGAGAAPALGTLHVIPCCYEMALDLDRVVA